MKCGPKFVFDDILKYSLWLLFFFVVSFSSSFILFFLFPFVFLLVWFTKQPTNILLDHKDEEPSLNYIGEPCECNS